MTVWKPMALAPKTDEPVLLKAGDDIGVAFKHGDDFYWLDVEDPANLKYVQAPDGWLPHPKSPEEAERLVSEAEALAREPERELAALFAQRDAINRELANIEAEERAAQRKAAQRAADERDHDAEQERLRQVRSLLPGGNA